MSNEQTQASDEDEITAALRASEANINRHNRLSLALLIGGVLALLIICVTAAHLAKLYGRVYRLDWRAAVSDYLKQEETVRTLEGAIEQYTYELSSHNEDLAEEKERLSGTEEAGATSELLRQLESRISEVTERIKSHKEALVEGKELLKSAGERLQRIEDGAIPMLPQQFIIGFSVLVAIIVLVFAALYRSHLQEIARNQNFGNGLRRILIAATHGRKAGYQSEVRRALASGAFDFDGATALFGRSKKVDSLLPGHPMYDLMAAVMNKALEKVDPLDKDES